MDFLPEIRDGCEAVINLSTGGSALMPLEERLAGPMAAQPEMCSLNMGTMNFALYPMLGKRAEWQHDWEEPFLRDSDDLVFKNTPRDILGILDLLGRQRGARFEFECYDVGHLYTLSHFLERGLVRPPLFVQFVFGVLGGIGADVDNLAFMKRTADKLLGEAYRFSVLAAGRHQMPLCATALAMGGNVRVGLEDSLYIAKGKLAASNAEQVRKIRAIAESLSLDVATPAEARAALDLKGGDRVAF